VAAAAASAVARRGTSDGDWMAQIRHRIAEHYQASVWHPGSS
jgi:hypothetical protein